MRVVCASAGLRFAGALRPELSGGWRVDVHVLRMTAVACVAQLLYVLLELVRRGGLARIISVGGGTLGYLVEGIEILPDPRRCRRKARRAVSRNPWFRLRWEQMWKS